MLMLEKMLRLHRIGRHIVVPGPEQGRPSPAGGAGPAIVRVAVFGAGGHARRAHLPSLRVMPNVEIVAIADSNRELAQSMADQLTTFLAMRASSEIMQSCGLRCPRLPLISAFLHLCIHVV